MSVCHGSLPLVDAGEVGAQECDISGLLDVLGKVKDRRGRRGRVYELVFILAASVVAVLAGASNFRQISDQVADFPQSLLR